MNKILPVFFALVVTVHTNNDLPSIYGMQRLGIYATGETKLRLVRTLESNSSFDLVNAPVAEEEPLDVMVEAKVAQQFKKFLKANGARFEVINKDVSRLVQPQMPLLRARFADEDSSRPFLANYPRYDEIKSYLVKLERDHGDMVKAFSIGVSSEGRDILGVKIFSGPGTERKPALFIDAGIHAREWMAPATALYAIEQLVENSTNHYITKDIDVFVLPLLNPDGYEYTFISPETRFWRKTRSRQMYDCIGVDANRNFEFMWMTIGASPLPCSHDYGGSHPFSEPETQALRDFLLDHKDHIKVYLTLHSFGQYILYPWGFTTEVPKNEQTLKCVAQKSEIALSRVRGTRYKIGSSTNVLYAAAGGSDDWAMGVAGIELAYTIELPGGPYRGYYGFAPPATEIEPVGRETFEAFKVFALYVNDEICHDRIIFID